MQGVFICNTNSVDLQDVSISFACSVDMLGVSISIAYNVDMHGVSISIAFSVDMQGVSIGNTSSVDWQGESISIACSVDMQGVSCATLAEYQTEAYLAMDKCANYTWQCHKPSTYTSYLSMLHLLVCYNFIWVRSASWIFKKHYSGLRKNGRCSGCVHTCKVSIFITYNFCTTSFLRSKMYILKCWH